VPLSLTADPRNQPVPDARGRASTGSRTNPGIAVRVRPWQAIATAVLLVEAGTLPPEIWGQCLVVAKGKAAGTRLDITLIPKSDPGYASYQAILAAGDVAETIGTDGYVVSEHAQDTAGEGATGARAAIIEPERVVVLRVLVPAAGGDTVEEAGVAVRTPADNPHHLG
jgi:hypothetical protein